MAELNLNANDWKTPETQSGFAPIPTGDYIITLDKTEKKTAKSGTEYLEFAFTVADGQYKNRKLWERYYIYDTSKPKSVNYAKSLISQMVLATGKTQIRDTAELEGIAFLAHIVKETYNGDERNAIKSYKPVPSISTPSVDTSAAPW